ncbi:MAG: RagB/SusD family nutrient uptake outer membrane protein [Candidatus Cryptobacteroides sp.]
MNKIHRILIIASAAVAAVSCAEGWKEKANNQWSDEDVWRISDMAMGVLNSAYTSMPTRPDSYGSNFLDAATDNALTNSYNSEVYKLTSGNWSSISNPLSNWSKCFTQFQYINTFLEKGLTENTLYDKVDADQDAAFKKRLFGEAHFLRAYWAFCLLRQYGGKTEGGEALGYPIAVQFITEEDAKDFSKFARNTYQECVDQIVSDCDTAIENLPVEYSGADVVLGASNIGLPTSLTAAALKSRVLLYGASPAYQNDDVVRLDGMGEFSVLDEDTYAEGWERAAFVADELIRTAGFGTEFYAITASDLADAGNVTPSEFLFRTFFNSKDMESRHFPPYYRGNANTVPSQNLVDAFPMANGYPVDDPESGYDPSDPYSNRDRRFYLNVYHHGASFGNSGEPINVMVDGKDGVNYNQNASVSGYYLAKFLSVNASILNPVQSSNAQHYYPEFRRAEVFLNFAEASNEAWGPSAKGPGCLYSAYEVVRMIRERSGGITDTGYLDKVAAEGKDAFRTLIQNERRLELAFENHRWYDLRRCLLPLAEPARGVEVSLNDGKLTYTDKVVAERKFNDVRYYYSPLPYDECVKNPDMVNNLGWK